MLQAQPQHNTLPVIGVSQTAHTTKAKQAKAGCGSVSDRVSVNPVGMACIINLLAILRDGQDGVCRGERSRLKNRQLFSNRTHDSMAEAGAEAADHLGPFLSGKATHAGTDEAPHDGLGSWTTGAPGAKTHGTEGPPHGVATECVFSYLSLFGTRHST